MVEVRRFSIIVTTHNRINYISKCLDSILQQTYKNFEIIIIDDNSEDGTDTLIHDKYNMDFIKYFKVKFNDISKVRNYALSKVNGDTMIFVDSDDWIEKYLLEKINEQDTQNDIIRYQAVMIDDDNKIREEFITNNFNNKRGIEVLNEFATNHEIYSPLWLYAYDVKFWKKNKFVFPEGKLQEDFAIMSLILSKTNYISSIPYVGYKYYRSSSSIMRNSNYQIQVKKAYDVLSHCDNFYNQIIMKQSDACIRSNLINYYMSVLKHKSSLLDGKDRDAFLKEISLRENIWR